MRKCQILAVLFCVLAANAALADPIYVVTMNTSGASGTTGSLDFQFDPGPLMTQAATVQITFFTGGSFVGLPQTLGGVTGELPAPITINNTSQLNDYFQSFTFGNSLSFVVSFSGPAVDSPNGTSTSTSEFAFSTFSDQNGTVPVLTSDPNGISATAVVNLNGSVKTSSISPDIQVQLAPEPGTLSMFIGAVAALGCFKLRRRSQRKTV
jgi:hypothetical protein